VTSLPPVSIGAAPGGGGKSGFRRIAGRDVEVSVAGQVVGGMHQPPGVWTSQLNIGRAAETETFKREGLWCDVLGSVVSRTEGNEVITAKSAAVPAAFPLPATHSYPSGLGKQPNRHHLLPIRHRSVTGSVTYLG